MSVGVGIGDICLILDGIITICQRAGETKQILQAAQRDVEILRSTVLLLRDEIGNERLFVKNGATEVSTIRSSLKPLRNDVREIQDMLTSYTSPAPTFLDKVRYATLDKNRFDDLREKFTGHRINIIVILNLIISKRQKGQTSVLHQIDRNQSKASAKQEKELKKLRTSVDFNGEKTSQSLEEILQLLKGDLSKPEAGPEWDAQSILLRTERHLATKGVTGEAAKSQILPLKTAIEAIIDVGKAPLRMTASRRVRTPEQAKRDTTPKHRRSVASSSSPPTTSRPVRSKTGIIEDYRILCVDENNGNISLLAQTFFEIARLKLAHGTGQWIFKRVDSKGLFHDDETLVPGADLAKCLSEISTNRYPWAFDYPNEIDRIIDRHKSQEYVSKFSAADFRAYNLIVCFTEADFEVLKAGRAEAAVRHPKILQSNTIKLLSGPEDVSAGRYLSALDTTSLVKAIREMVENFINEDFGSWYRRTKVPAEERYRILQFTMPVKSLPLGAKERGYSMSEIPQVKDWEKEMGCEIKITKLASGDESGKRKDQCLVSVIGPKGSNLGFSQSGIDSTLHKVESLFRNYRA